MTGSDWIARELRRMMLRRITCSCLLELMSCGTCEDGMLRRPLLDEYERLLLRENELESRRACGDLPERDLRRARALLLVLFLLSMGVILPRA